MLTRIRAYTCTCSSSVHVGVKVTVGYTHIFGLSLRQCDSVCVCVGGGGGGGGGHNRAGMGTRRDIYDLCTLIFPPLNLKLISITDNNDATVDYLIFIYYIYMYLLIPP